jgi:ElaB/YqjD/DUF883 family membrane-anchored ribosome-binding protein
MFFKRHEKLKEEIKEIVFSILKEWGTDPAAIQGMVRSQVKDAVERQQSAVYYNTQAIEYRIKTALNQISSEAFIDDIVNRIKKKQLP